MHIVVLVFYLFCSTFGLMYANFDLEEVELPRMNDPQDLVLRQEYYTRTGQEVRIWQRFCIFTDGTVLVSNENDMLKLVATKSLQKGLCYRLHCANAATYYSLTDAGCMFEIERHEDGRFFKKNLRETEGEIGARTELAPANLPDPALFGL